MAPAGTVNTNLTIDTNGKQEIGSWQFNPDTGIGDGLGAVLFSLFENPGNTTQVTFQNSGWLGNTPNQSHGGINAGIANGLVTNSNAGSFGNASFTGGVQTANYTYGGSSGTRNSHGNRCSSASGNVMWQSFAAGTGFNGGNLSQRPTTTNNDLTGNVAIAGANVYLGIDAADVNTAGKNQQPVTIILESGSQSSRTSNSNGTAVDNSFKLTSLGSGASSVSVDAFDKNPGNPGGSLLPSSGFLNLQYHDTAGVLSKPGSSGVLPYSTQTGADPIVSFTGLTVGSSNTSVLTFNPSTVSFGRVIQTFSPTVVNAILNDAPGNGTDAGSFTGVTSNNGISGPASGTAAVGNNSVALQLLNNSNGSGALGNNSWTYTITNTSNTSDIATPKVVTASADIVQNRVISASSINVGRILVGTTINSTITGNGADTLNTTPSVNAVNFVIPNGLTLNTGTGGILNAANATRTLGVNLGQAGTVSTNVNLATTSTAIFAKEGLTGETINGGNIINLAITANPVNLRVLTPNPVTASGSISGAGPISIPFSFTSTGDLATTTSVIANNGGGTISGTGGAGASGFTTSGSYTFNGGQATIGNVVFNSGTDSYTASGTITGTLTAGQVVSGSVTLPVTTLETGLGDTYAPIVVNFTARSTTGGGNNSLLSFIPGTASFGNVLLHATPTLNVNLNNAGTQSGSFTGVTSNNGLTGPVSGAAAVGNNTFVLQLQNNANGTGTLNANASFTYTVTNTSNGADTAAPKTLTVSANVGEAIADTTNQPFAFGAPLFGTVMGGSSYAALSSTVSAGNGLSNPINQTTGGPVEHSTATILAGNNGRPNAVVTTMAWRTRNLNETPSSQGGTPTSPPLPPGGAQLISDVVNLTRIDAINGGTPTDPYTLQMNYDPATVGNLAQQNALAANRGLFLAWLDPNGAGPGMIGWDNAVLGNTGNNATPSERDFIGSFAAFQAVNGTTLSNYIAAWGVDTSRRQHGRLGRLEPFQPVRRAGRARSGACASLLAWLVFGLAGPFHSYSWS